MRRSQASYILTLGGLLCFGLGALAMWAVLAAGSGEWPGWLIVLLVLLVVAGGLLYRFVSSYLFDIKALTDDARLMLNANPQHRVDHAGGSAHARDLADLLNQFGDQFERLTTERDAEIGQARADLESERNMLVALMAELTEGVIICNADGQILLYNQQARELLAHGGDSILASEGFVGLGRSIFEVVHRDKLSFALEHLQMEAGNKAEAEAKAESEVHVEGQRSSDPIFDVSTGFVTTVAQNRLARLRLSPCRNQQHEFVGYVLTFENVSAEIARMEQMLTSYDLLDEAAAGAVANVVAGERAWRLEDMHVDDVIAAVVAHLGQRLRIDVSVDGARPDLWLKIDSYALLHALTSALRELAEQASMTDVRVGSSVAAGGAEALLTVQFDAELSDGAWASWQERALRIDASDQTLTLNELATRHGGSLHFPPKSSAQPSSAHYEFVLRFPTSQIAVNAKTSFVIGSRPEMYDFDLFATPLPDELMEQPLASLIYTVFDTETTGLNISHGSAAVRDTLLSVGAVRVVNGRLLRQEVFDQLVDPQRKISAESTGIHGITDEMVAGQPLLSAVLPAFHRYANGTVLVAHNAAFDMRLLEVNEELSGVRFANPVLDTLLLSTIVHPDQDDHALESIAARLGVRVRERHTALGDALTTAEVFLGLLPLLAEAGIVTLADAIEASKKSYLARVQY